MKAHTDGTGIIKGVIKPLLIGTLIGAAVSVLLLFAMALIATWIDIPPVAVLPLVVIPLAVGAFVGGAVVAKLTGRNGWLMGIFSALLLFLISFVAGLGINGEINSSFMFTKCLIMCACGMVGGMIAINLRNAK